MTKANNAKCYVQWSDRGYAVCMSGRLFGFEGKVDSGAWVMKVAADSFSFIL